MASFDRLRLGLNVRVRVVEPLGSTPPQLHLPQNRHFIYYPLLFVDDLTMFAKGERDIDSLLSTVNAKSKDIYMEFRIQKCSVLVLKGGEVVKSEGIK